MKRTLIEKEDEYGGRVTPLLLEFISALEKKVFGVKFKVTYHNEAYVYFGDDLFFAGAILVGEKKKGRKYVSVFKVRSPHIHTLRGEDSTVTAFTMEKAVKNAAKYFQRYRPCSPPELVRWVWDFYITKAFDGRRSVESKKRSAYYNLFGTTSPNEELAEEILRRVESGELMFESPVLQERAKRAIERTRALAEAEWHTATKTMVVMSCYAHGQDSPRMVYALYVGVNADSDSGGAPCHEGWAHDTNLAAGTAVEVDGKLQPVAIPYTSLPEDVIGKIETLRIMDGDGRQYLPDVGFMKEEGKYHNNMFVIELD